MSEPTRTAEQLRPYARVEGKPVLASWMGGADVAAGVEILNQAGIPTFAYPDTAARVFHAMWRSAYNLRGLYETPTFDRRFRRHRGGPCRAEAIGSAVRRAGRTVLTEVESKQLLAAYAIPTVETRVAKDETEAVAAADALGYPVVLKLFSETITHKTDVGGVRLNLPDAEAVRRAFAAIEASVARAGGRRALPGGDRPADGPPRRLRADRRQQPRPAVRPGPALRHRGASSSRSSRTGRWPCRR